MSTFRGRERRELPPEDQDAPAAGKRALGMRDVIRRRAARRFETSCGKRLLFTDVNGRAYATAQRFESARRESEPRLVKVRVASSVVGELRRSVAARFFPRGILARSAGAALAR